MTDEELMMVRDAGAMTCSTTMGEHSYPFPSIHGRARAAGVAAGIGVDGALAFTHDYFQHVRGAFYNLFRTEEGKKLALGYQGEDVLDFVTRLGARAIRDDGVTGTLTVGKRADVLLLRTDRIGFPVVGKLADRVVNYANQPDLDSVWIAGVAHKRHGRMIGIDMAALKAKTNAASARINREGDTIKFV
jgi:cytosine/adenosine deaminase-related metal-dependent hydrolase